MLERESIGGSENKKMTPIYDVNKEKPVVGNNVHIVGNKAYVHEAGYVADDGSTMVRGSVLDKITESETVRKQEPKENGVIAETAEGKNLGSMSIETATDCMICGNPFMVDWQYKNFNMCPKCRQGLKRLLEQQQT